MQKAFSALSLVAFERREWQRIKRLVLDYIWDPLSCSCFKRVSLIFHTHTNAAYKATSLQQLFYYPDSMLLG